MPSSTTISIAKHREASRVQAEVFLAIAAPSAPAPQSPHPRLLEVTRCEPQAGGVGYPGFVPGFYPGFPYHWYDPYGYWYYQPPIAGSATLSIDYMNVTQKTMRQIDFGLIARGQLIAEVRDVGIFSPHVEIKHIFGLDPNVFPIGTALPRCVPLDIVYQDGTLWKNPHLPALRRTLYQRPER